MNGIDYLNIGLWIIDTIVVGSIAIIYFWFTKIYQNWQVWTVNSGNDVIDSTALNRLVHEFRLLFNLQNYEINFIDDDQAHKMFWNLKKRQHKIVITKQIFVSVGYELDYIISRLWLSAKELEKNSLIRWYKVLVKYLPIIFLTLTFISYFFQTVIFILGLSSMGSLNSSLLEFLWTKPFMALLTVLFFGLLGIDYYLAAKIKVKVEFAYNQEVLKLVKGVLELYFFDFTAARQYAQQIPVPFLLTFNPKHEKWLGPFTY